MIIAILNRAAVAEIWRPHRGPCRPELPGIAEQEYDMSTLRALP